jgi:hypothetical protein
VLFSLTKFWEDHGNAWPEGITIVSHAFKRERLVDCHCRALGYPLERVSFVGVDPPDMVDGMNEAAMKGVVQAVTEWKENPHGADGGLAEKRKKRNPWSISQKLFSSDENRRRSGVRTVMLNGEEFLDPEAVQPWCKSSFAGDTGI